MNKQELTEQYVNSYASGKGRALVAGIFAIGGGIVVLIGIVTFFVALFNAIFEKLYL